jgi:hypothetical protein
MINDVVIHNGLLRIATGTFVCMVGHSEKRVSGWAGLLLGSRLGFADSSFRSRQNSRAARVQEIQRELERLENGIAHLPLRHPLRAGPEARIAELKAAQIARWRADPATLRGALWLSSFIHPLVDAAPTPRAEFTCRLTAGNL